MEWDLPKSIEIDGINHKIRNDCDYRVVLDTISALTDESLIEADKLECALYIFYDNIDKIEDIQTAVTEMIKIINLGKEIKTNEPIQPKIMDWGHDFDNIAPPVSRVLGYSVRDSKNYTHWYDFIGAYMEIGDCYFAQIISLRNKRKKGKKLEDYEISFYREHKKDIDLPTNLSEEEKEWLSDDW